MIDFFYCCVIIKRKSGRWVMLKLENEILIEFLTAKLNEEMKNVSKKLLTDRNKSDRITLSTKERKKSP